MPNCPSRYGGHWALLTGKALIFLRSHSFDSKFEVRTWRLSVINDESPLCGGAAAQGEAWVRLGLLHSSDRPTRGIVVKKGHAHCADAAVAVEFEIQFIKVSKGIEGVLE